MARPSNDRQPIKVKRFCVALPVAGRPLLLTMGRAQCCITRQLISRLYNKNFSCEPTVSNRLP